MFFILPLKKQILSGQQLPSDIPHLVPASHTQVDTSKRGELNELTAVNPVAVEWRRRSGLEETSSSPSSTTGQTVPRSGRPSTSSQRRGLAHYLLYNVHIYFAFDCLSLPFCVIHNFLNRTFGHLLVY